MAKKDKKRFRIPKEIAGVKVPKEARRAGEAILDKANSPEGRKALASGLTMAATAAAALMAKRAGDAAATQARDAASEPRQPGAADPQQMADVIGQAASAFMAKMFTPR